jgi:hypothetical protein
VTSGPEYLVGFSTDQIERYEGDDEMMRQLGGIEFSSSKGLQKLISQKATKAISLFLTSTSNINNPSSFFIIGL